MSCGTMAMAARKLSWVTRATFAVRSQALDILLRRGGMQEPDHRHRRLLPRATNGQAAAEPPSSVINSRHSRAAGGAVHSIRSGQSMPKFVEPPGGLKEKAPPKRG
jgi:hypothetical protein